MGGHVPDRIGVGKRGPPELQCHGFEQPIVRGFDDETPKSRELSPRLFLAPVSQHGKVEFRQVPERREQLGGEEPAIARVPLDEFDECIRVEEEPRRPTIPCGPSP